MFDKEGGCGDNIAINDYVTDISMDYPIEIEQMDCTPITIDNGYRVIDVELLAKWIAQLLMGNSVHITRIIEGLEPHFANLRNEAIDGLIAKIDVPTSDKTAIYKRDGWLFQMMSWIALNMNLHASFDKEQIYMNVPHTAAAQQGIDGFALVLDKNRMIKHIIITEDKCTKNARGKITSQVFPEFEKYEKGLNDPRVLAEIGGLIRNEDGGALLIGVQDDITKSQYWVYRIGITRQAALNDQDARIAMYDGYEKVVKGNMKRRDASSIHIDDLRNWMASLSKMVVKELEAKKR